MVVPSICSYHTPLKERKVKERQMIDEVKGFLIHKIKYNAKGLKGKNFGK